MLVGPIQVGDAQSWSAVAYAKPEFAPFMLSASQRAEAWRAQCAIVRIRAISHLTRYPVRVPCCAQSVGGFLKERKRRSVPMCRKKSVRVYRSRAWQDRVQRQPAAARFLDFATFGFQVGDAPSWSATLTGYPYPRNLPFSAVYRFAVSCLRTAMPSAFFVPTRMTSFFPRVMPV